MIRRTLTLSIPLALPAGAALAQSSGDATCCKALVDRYRTVTGGTQNGQTVANAMEQCSKGNPAAGMPVLEQALKDNKSSFPPRQ